MKNKAFFANELTSAGPEGRQKKLQNLDPMNQSQRKLGLMYVLHMVLIIGHYYCGFGGIQDRFDPILPPDFL
jgi:hypothetical protein